ncbi:WW domain-containing oxidoreductase [Mycena venus]|uniref:WW domain-containing oxidoreductase n=1 Tax=Mycena venus TaxID=2733690 RepID=A0A8H6X7W8_9AGAR|nr:WW domain-containing oxidoreductase [Mycena venus]
MIQTAEKYSTLPRLVIVSNEVHYWVEIEKSVCENPDMFRTFGRSEYCTKKEHGLAIHAHEAYAFQNLPAFSPPLTEFALGIVLNVFFARALNDRLPPSTPLIVNTVNPGLCKTEIMREAKGIQAFVAALLQRILAFTAEEGSRQLVWAAVGGQPQNLRGQYITSSHVSEVSDFALGPQGIKAQNQLWDELVDILGEVDPRVTVTVNNYLAPNSA